MALKKSDVAEAISRRTAADDGGGQVTFVVGEQLFVRTVTNYVTGRVERVTVCHGIPFLHLTHAAWVAESGRFTPAIATGELGEVEPVEKPVRVAIHTIVDVYHWDHPLPRKQK